jgi:hypothetical protein
LRRISGANTRLFIQREKCQNLPRHLVGVGPQS